jgi:(d)CTP diphosphatase
LTVSSDKPVVGIIGIMQQGERLLVIQRAHTVKAPLSWCFPGGHIEDGETEPEALIREMQEELGIDVEPGKYLMTQTKHHGRLVLHCWSAKIVKGEVTANPREIADYAWMTPAEIREKPGVIEGMTDMMDTIGL